jgi:hypothetical protein
VDERVARLKTPKDCEQFAKNVEARLPELAREARRRAIELRANEHKTQTQAEREALQAVYAYEKVLTAKHRKKTRASRTWQIINRHGIIPAVERVVGRKADSAGFTALVSMGMEDFAFEAVVMRHPEVFSQETVNCAEARLAKWT